MRTSAPRDRAWPTLVLAMHTLLLTHFLALPAVAQIKVSEITIGNHHTFAI